MEAERTEIETGNDRWVLIRDVLVFQGKLLVDGFRDLALVPMSLAAGVVSLIRKGPSPGPEFYDLLRMAQRSERWINLFGAVEKPHAGRADSEADRTDARDDTAATTADLDTLVARVENFLVEEYRKGGITAQAKARMDAALVSLRGVRHRMGRDKAV